MTIQALTHIGMCVSNLERSRLFYTDLLGFKAVSKLEIADEATATLTEIPGMKLQCVFIERDGIRLELMNFPSPGHTGDTAYRPLNHVGLTHLALRVDDLDALLTRLERGGATILRHTRIANEEFGSDVIFVTDPDGVRIELVSMPGDPRAALGEAIE